MLLEAGLSRANVFATNVVARRPPGNELHRLFRPYDRHQPSWRGLNPTEEVLSEISRCHRQLAVVQPKVIIAAGNYALWALTADAGISSISLGDGTTVKVPSGITSWRGSMLESQDPTLPDHLRGRRVLPIIHPAAILRAWYNRSITVHDLRERVPLALKDDWRAKPAPTICIPQSANEAVHYLKSWMKLAELRGELRLANDIETMKRTFITCIGFGHGPFNSEGFALVIPLIKAEANGTYSSWWSPSDEARIMAVCREVLTHPNIHIEGQNYLYDTQYFQRWLGVTPKLAFDTMLAQHLCFPGTPKGLDYLSSLYCHYHRYWKEDGKDWDLRGDQHRHLLYNGEDCLRTFECSSVLRGIIKDMDLSRLWENECRKNDFALRVMNRGLLVDKQRRARVAFELMATLSNIHARLATIIPGPIVPVKNEKKRKMWYESERQQVTLFYEILGLNPQKNRKTKRPTINDEALNTLAEKHPELITIFELLKAERSIGVLYSNAVTAENDPDGRMRCFINTSGAETFRWSTSTNAFGRGTNLQNLTTGDEE